ncbi:MAG: nuclease A inhibitor family protein [Chloroflexi bacterium]|nr:nuclease A inhibitor family protein [Chloroflexota bacterium]
MATLIDEIARASEGLMLISETDAPVTPFVWEESTPFSIEALRQARGYDASTPITKLDVDEFFGSSTREYDWHGPEEQERVRRFRALVDTLKSRLSDIAAYKVGEFGAIDVFVVGRTEDGTFAGVTTHVVET